MKTPTNILYLHSHDTGRVIEPYGYPAPTPNFMRLATDSLMFRSMFCANPTCSPSRAALLTGQYAHSCGQLGLAHRGFEMPSFDHHIARHLGDAGYHTVLSGVQHIAHQNDPPGRIGYNEYLGPPARADVEAARWLSTRPSSPFFLSCGFFETHRPFPEFSESEAMIRAKTPGAPRPCGYPDQEPLRLDFAMYLESLKTLDERVGVVLDALEESGLADSTILVCTTDHGIPFPDMKCTLKDAGTGVLFFLRVPGREPKCIDAMASHVDVFPTICDLVGVEKPDWLEGKSLVPLIDGTEPSVRDEVFAEVNFHAASEPMRMVRTQRYKLIRRFHDRHVRTLSNVDRSRSKDFFVEAGWHTIPLASEELYDLYVDPEERCNRIADSSLSGITNDLRGRLQRWMEKTNDPLLDGPLVPPKGVLLNSPEGASPSEPPTLVT